jgi:hypothetical protein
MPQQLSDLQQNILGYCLEQKFVTSQELLSGLWGWPPQDQETQKANIDKAAYNAAHASLSRCLTRLYIKNLIRIWKSITGQGTGVSLTREGLMLIQTSLKKAEEDTKFG